MKTSQSMKRASTFAVFLGLFFFAILQDASADSFTNTGSMNIARWAHTATILRNGEVLVAGGVCSSSCYLSSVEIFNPTNGTWLASSSMNMARFLHTTTLLPSGKVLVAGGSHGNGADSSAELYDPATAIWTAVPTMNTARYGHTATLLPNGKVLIAGGSFGGNTPTNSAELFDPATGTWTMTGAMTAPRWAHTATLLPNGKVLVAGGFLNTVATNGAEIYDPSSETWTATSAMNFPRVFHSATSLSSGLVLLVGGTPDGQNFFSSAELYNPTTGNWAMTGTMNTARMSHTMTLLPNGKVLVTGGFGSGYNYLSSAELYDSVTGTWAMTDSLNTNRAYHTATLLLNGQLLVAGGEESYASASASAELYGNSLIVMPASLNDGLVAYYPFNGNANDASGNGNNGTVNGTILTTNRFGTPNSAYYFPGNNDWISVPDAPSLDLTNGYTLSAWINFEVGGIGAPRIADKFMYSFYTYLNGNARSLGMYFSDQTSLTTPTNLYAGQWYNVVSSYDLHQRKIYVNGDLVASDSCTFALIPNSLPLEIGRKPVYGYDNFKGIIDDVSVYNRALSDSEVQQLYSVGNSLGNTTASVSQPTQISLNSPSPASGVDSLVLVTHGVEPFYDIGGKNLFGDISWITNMANSIRAQVPSNWEVRTLDWTTVSQATEPDVVSLAGIVGGHLYGSQLAQQRNWKHVHLIAHSAGSSVIEAIASELKAANPSVIIHETFLDPYLGSLHQLQSYFGYSSDWLDNYFAANGLSLWTNAKLPHANNVDVSWLDSADITYVTNYWSPSGMADTTPATIYEQQIPVGVQAYVSSSHGWPHDFYQATITGGLANTSGYGFPLSEEDGWNNFASYPENNDPVVLNGQLANYQRLTPAQTGGQIPFSLLPNATSSSGVNFTGNSGATLFNTLSFSPFVANGAGVRPMGGGTTIAPAWLSVEMTITNSANFVQFDAAFTDSNSAQGLLTVYWDTNQIGMVDERAASTNWQTYSFPLPATVTNDVHILGFRLDSFNNTLSSVAVTNVATGFAGVNQPVALGVALFTNSTPILQLTGASNYNYLVECSTNLVNWTPTALLVNSNGTAFFADRTATNSPAKFYRAVMP